MTRHFTVTAMILRDREILLIDHRKSGLMLPPGGHIDPDEDPVQTVHREVREEVGLEVEIVERPHFLHPDATTLPPPFTINVIDNVTDPVTGLHTHIDLVYVCRPLSHEVWVDRNEVGGHLWVPINSVARLKVPAELPALALAAMDHIAASNGEHSGNRRRPSWR